VRRVVVDTNVWVSGLLKPGSWPARVRRGLEAGRFALVTSEPMLAELSDVLARPRIVRRYGVRPDEVAALLALIREQAEVVAVTGTLALCRDPKDDIVLETAVVGGADTLVTRDDDLKGESDLVRALSERGVAVLSVQRFLDAIGRDTLPPTGEPSYDEGNG
jgi:putative PIN family toxin of toxin-antitoxin system